ncbi:MAG: exopolysaccharide biosynthesis protein [Paracoccus sp. (in: a-proteobacteria)]|nr:exopolysaccharide biosynthesis protein [Marinibacterium profundimaris]
MRDPINPDKVATPDGMSAVIDEINEAVEDGETNVGDLLDAMGRTSFVPVLMVPALAIVSPLSGVPGFSSAAGILIAVISTQLLIGRRGKLWLPGVLRRRRVPSRWVEKVADSLHDPARWLDTHTRPRLSFLAAAPFNRVIYAACIFCGLSMPFMELLPFTSSIMALAVLLMSLTLLVRDGLFALAGYLVISLLLLTAIMLII